MSLERFCRKEVVTGRADEQVFAAARKMREGHVGALVIVDERSRPVGILTDRDLICRVLAAGRDANNLLVEAVMSRDLVVIGRTGTIDEAAFSMRKHGVRRIPVVNADGSLAGMVAFDDLVVLLAAELGETVAALRQNRGP